MTRWAVALPLEEAGQAGRLRLEPGVEALVEARAEGATFWLRGGDLTEEVDFVLRQLAGALRYRVMQDGQLVAAGDAVPKGWLPSDRWQPLADWLLPELPALLESQLPPADYFRLKSGPPQVAPVALTLVRESAEAEPSVLLTSLDSWHAYSQTAARVRLERWSFAVDEEGRVLVRGTPLPPLRGGLLVDRDGIFTPAGWAWSPAVEPSVVRNLLGLEKGDCAWLRTDGSWERIAAQDWVRGARSAVRITAAKGEA